MKYINIHYKSKHSVSKGTKGPFTIICLMLSLAFTHNSLFAQYFAGNSAGVGAGTNNTAVGAYAGNSTMTSAADDNSFYGYASGYFNTSGKSNCFFGSYSGSVNSTGSENVYIGMESGLSGTSASYNTFVGKSTGQFNTASENSFYGYESGLNNTTGTKNSFFGFQAGNLNTTSSNNSFFGYKAGAMNTGDWNTFIGIEAGQANTTGVKNSFIGSKAGYFNTTGSYNSFIGWYAGLNNTTGQENTFIGKSAGRGHISGQGNSFIGSDAGYSNNTGSNNSFLGYAAGAWVEGSNNIMLGSYTGPPSNGNGYIDSLLFIDVEQTIDPLIYGDFSSDFVKINGTFEVTAGLSNPSDVNRKNNFLPIDPSAILEKIEQLPIQQWTYKDRTDEKHIGATAQDFRAAFGLGAGDTTISTIDADGVALAAIQALKKENDALQDEVKDLKSILHTVQAQLQSIETKVNTSKK